VTGDDDYLLKAVPADLKSLSVLINDRLPRHEGVARVRSAILLDRLNETTRLTLRAPRLAERARRGRALP